MTVFFNANSVSELKFTPPGGSRATAIAVPVEKKDLQDFFPEFMSFISYHRESVDCFKEMLKCLVLDALNDIGESVKSELAQFDRDEEMKKRHLAQYQDFEAAKIDKEYLYPNLRSKGKMFNGIPSQSTSLEEQKRQTALAIYYRSSKNSILARIDSTCWFSLKAVELFTEREQELEQLYADAEIYETKVKYSAASAALSFASVAAKSVAVSNAVKKEAASVFFNKIPESIATRNLVASTLSISSKIDKVSISSGLGMMLSENIRLGEIKAKSGVATEPIDSMRFDSMRFLGKIGEGLQLVEGYVGFSAGVVDMGYNNLAAMHTYDAIASFHETVGGHVSKMSKAVHQDFERLDEKEIDTLIENVLKINIKEYIPLWNTSTK